MGFCEQFVSNFKFSILFVQREEALAARQKFMSSEGDHITLLNIYRAYKSVNGNKVCTTHINVSIIQMPRTSMAFNVD